MPPNDRALLLPSPRPPALPVLLWTFAPHGWSQRCAMCTPSSSVLLAWRNRLGFVTHARGGHFNSTCSVRSDLACSPSGPLPERRSPFALLLGWLHDGRRATGFGHNVGMPCFCRFRGLRNRFAASLRFLMPTAASPFLRGARQAVASLGTLGHFGGSSVVICRIAGDLFGRDSPPFCPALRMAVLSGRPFWSTLRTSHVFFRARALASLGSLHFFLPDPAAT